MHRSLQPDRPPAEGSATEFVESHTSSTPAGGLVSHAPPAVQGRLPDFFVVGHAKSGTSALYAMLRRHPQIFMPESKEPWFFADELHDRTPPRPEGTPKTLEEYVAWFAGATDEQLVGEASALYLWSHTAARRIGEVRPDARIIAILREPASFLRSLHLQLIESYVETENDLAKAIALEPARRSGRQIPRYTYWPQTLLYSEHVRYVEQLRRYHAVFAREQVLVLTYDEFRDDNEATVRRVLRFLGVDDTVPIEPLRVNPTVRARSQRLHELVHAVSVGRGPLSLAVKAAIKKAVPHTLRRDAVRAVRGRLVYGPPREADDDLMLELRQRFKQEVVALSEYLDRDLVTLWGYDRID
jgi:Sulfotransferase domain